MAAHGITYLGLNMQKGFMRLCVTDTVLDNDCCVQTPRKNCPPRVYKFSKTLGVTLKFYAPGRVTKNRLTTENQQVLDCSIQNLVTMVTWYPGFMHPCCYLNA